jgi:HAD superfamily hydrolase (TIGR01490 family)
VQAAFFDLDKTVIAKASMVAFGPSLLGAGLITKRQLVRALWSQLIFQAFGAGEERMKRFREKALRVTKGWEQATVTTLVRETLIEVIEPIVFDEALALIRDHQAAGRLVYIVSASPAEIVVPLAEYLRVDGAIASRPRLDDAGRYTGEVEFYSYGPFKAEAIREVAETEGIDLDASFAYSDSITDLPMLEVVGHPTAVNPDKELAKVARERGWEVCWFSERVPLGERVHLPRGRVAAISGVVVGAAAAGAGLTWWVLHRRRPATRWERAVETVRSKVRLPGAS